MTDLHREPGRVFWYSGSHFNLFTMERLVFLKDEPRGPSQLVEVPVNLNGQQRVPFPDQSQLRSTTVQKIIIKAIRLITPDVLTNAPLSGNVNAPVTELQKISLVIYCEGWEKGQFIPILSLNDMQLLGGTAPNAQSLTKFSDWVNVDWPKCFLQYSNGTNTAGTPYSVLLDVLYVKLDAQNNEIKGAS